MSKQDNEIIDALLRELPGGPEGETPENRLKRLAMRSMRRGIKEMDIILKQYADAHLADMSPEALDHYEALLGNNDQDLYKWVSGRAVAPAQFSALIEEIAAFSGVR